MDVADARRQHRHAEVGDALALGGVRDLAAAHDAVLLAADRADLALDRNALGSGQRDNLLALFNVLLDRIVGAVEHDRREARRDRLFGALIAAVVEVQRHRHGDAEAFDHRFGHRRDRLEAAHIFARALGDAENDGGIAFLRREQGHLGPLKVIDVELPDRVMSLMGPGKHVLRRY